MRFTLRLFAMSILMGSTLPIWVQAETSPREQQVKILPVPVEQTEPEYPRELMAEKIEGEVIVEFTVTDIGLVKSAQAYSSTHPGFEEAAVKAVQQWLFEPGSRNGVTTSMRMRVPVIFKVPPDYLSTTLFEIPPGERPAEWAYDAMPRMQSIGQGVYPFDDLLENKRTTVQCVVTISAEGRVIDIHWPHETEESFKKSVHAVMDTARLTPAKRDEKAVTTTMNLKLVFNPYDGDVRISDEAAAILKKLRIEGPEAHFETEQALDAPIATVEAPDPIFPTQLISAESAGEAVIEYYIDATGRAQLPRMVTATAPAFGYAACQAIASWKFEPPLKEGQPVVVKMRTAVRFNRDTLAPEL